MKPLCQAEGTPTPYVSKETRVGVTPTTDDVSQARTRGART